MNQMRRENVGMDLNFRSENDGEEEEEEKKKKSTSLSVSRRLYIWCENVNWMSVSRLENI